MQTIPGSPPKRPGALIGAGLRLTRTVAAGDPIRLHSVLDPEAGAEG
jgi:hypothetical protein